MNERNADIKQMAIAMMSVLIAFLNNNWRVIGFHHNRRGSALDDNRLGNNATFHDYRSRAWNQYAVCNRRYNRSLDESH